MPAAVQPASQNLKSSVALTFDHWKHLVAESFVPLAARTADVDGFRGQLRSRVLDRMSVVEVTATSHEVHRTPALIAQASERYFKLNLQLEGTGLLIQDNREALLRPGDLAIYDTNRPYTLAFEEEARMMVVMFPCDALSLPTDYVGQLAAVRMAGSTGLSGIVGQFIRQLSENLEVLSGPSGSRLATNALDLVSTLLHAEMDIAPDRMKPQALLAVSVREYIEANLSDPQLSPASIAAAHFISTRHLHNVFHESGTTVATLDQEPAAGRRTPRAAGSAACRQAGGRCRRPLGVPRRSALQPHLPRRLRRFPQRLAPRRLTTGSA